MEFVEEKKDNGLSDIILLALGAVAFYYIFVKPRQQTQTISSKQSQQYDQYQNSNQYQQSQQEPISTYNNEESWEIVRGEDGHITNLRVARDATVGNSVSHERSQSPITGLGLGNLDNLDKTIKEMIQKNMQDMSQFNQRFANMKINDDERKRKFGFN